jgi:predicted HAD superfamily phosphohydrolase
MRDAAALKSGSTALQGIQTVPGTDRKVAILSDKSLDFLIGGDYKHPQTNTATKVRTPKERSQNSFLDMPDNEFESPLMKEKSALKNSLVQLIDEKIVNQSSVDEDGNIISGRSSGGSD